jgi:hypothetical protein
MPVNLESWSFGALLYELLFGKETHSFASNYNPADLDPAKRPIVRPSFILNVFKSNKVLNAV